MKTIKIYKYRIPSNIDCAGEVVRDALKTLCGCYNAIDENTVFDLKVILNELLLNAIKHGNKYSENKFVNIVVGFSGEDTVFIIIEDEGEGYKCVWSEADKPSSPELQDICDMKETGRGLKIVKCLCDNMKLNNKGNKVVIIKRLCNKKPV